MFRLQGPDNRGKLLWCEVHALICPTFLWKTPDDRQFAQDDPRKFLSNYPKGAVFDEVQRVPEIFSYLQEIVDEDKSKKYVLSGSQNFLLAEQVSQSLAGRVGILKLLPFSMAELKNVQLIGQSFEEVAYTGFYPRIFDQNIQPGDFYPNYIQTYVERDVRQLTQVSNLNTFSTFLKLCAGGVGQLLNLSELSNDNCMVIGAYLTVSGNSTTGAAYVFEKPESGWQDMNETAILTASDWSKYGSFGVNVAIENDIIAVGTIDSYQQGPKPGSVYIFKKPEGGWIYTTENKKLLPNDNQHGNRFGIAFAISQNTILVGCPYDDFNSDTSGSSYFFEKTSSQTLDYVEKLKIAPIPHYPNTKFKYGNAVSIDGNYAVVGAYRNNHDGNESGAAYVLKKIGSQWSIIAKLKPKFGRFLDNFGISVDISGDYVVIGANDGAGYSIGTQSGAGKAYIFVKPEGGWQDMEATALLKPSISKGGKHFGSSVAIHGNLVVVGIDLEDHIGYEVGKAYVFQKPASCWKDMTETAILTPTSGIDNDHFGKEVAIYENTIVVAAPNRQTYGNNTGSVYVFEKPADGWINMTETAQLKTTSPTEDNLFGRSIGIYGNNIVVGSFNPVEEGVDHSVAFLYTKPENGWASVTQSAILKVSDWSLEKLIGNSVSITNDHIVLGAINDDEKGTESGSIYIYDKPDDGWSSMEESRKLTAADGSQFDHFGTDVAISRNKIIVGAPQKIVDGHETGSAYIFEGPSVPNNQLSFSAGDNQSIMEDAGIQIVETWATNINYGDNDKQQLSFQVTNDNNNLFSTQPTIDQNGTLTYEVNENAYGEALVNAMLVHDGSEAGGISTSEEQTFNISVAPVNDAPTLSQPLNREIELGVQPEEITLAIFDVDNTNEELIFTVISDNPNIVDQDGIVGALIDNGYILTLNPKENQVGKTIITANLSDGELTDEVTFSLTINGIIIIGIDDISFSSDISAYPNPVTNLLEIELPDHSQHYALKVFNVYGKLIDGFEGLNTNSSMNINVSKYQNGAYLIKIECDQERYVIRFLKQ